MYDVTLFRFGPKLNYKPKIDDLNILDSNITQLYDKWCYDLIIVFDKLEDIHNINFAKLNYWKLFIILNDFDYDLSSLTKHIYNNTGDNLDYIFGDIKKKLVSHKQSILDSLCCITYDISFGDL